MSFRIATLNVRGFAARYRSMELCCFLQQHAIDIAFVQEANVTALDNKQDLCFGYKATIAPSTSTIGSELACVAASGVTILWQRILWPGKIAVVCANVRGHQRTFVNCHLSHALGERLLQLQTIAAEAIRGDTWVLGDLNISEDSTSDINPAGPTTPPRQTCIAAMHRSRMVVARVATLFDEASSTITDLSNRELWINWTSIKANIVSQIKCLGVPRVAEDDDIIRANRFLQARLEAASMDADYPSLPDLSRALRVHRSGLNNIYDENGRPMEGQAARRKIFTTFRERFSRPSCDPYIAADFLREVTTPIILENSDPLHRHEIFSEEITAAIRRLPLERALRWDEITCVLMMAFDEFFVGALQRLFEASRICGELPSSSRRNSICLIPKSSCGPGLNGYRPISISTTDYRVLSSVLLGRLRPHLPRLVPKCQTYAVPGRSSSWNIARVSDEVAAASRNNTPLTVISTDLESAFDTLDRGFLISLLVSLRLPPAFIGWLLALYAGTDATFRVNKHYTRPFHLLNGVKQCCAASAALFSIATGPLLRLLEWVLGQGNVQAYADDINLLIWNDEQFKLRSVVWCLEKPGRFPSGHLLVNSPIKGAGLSSDYRVWNISPGEPSGRTDGDGRCKMVPLRPKPLSRWEGKSCKLSSVVNHLHGYLPTDSTISKLQARLVRLVWGPGRTAWLPGGVLARPVSMGGFGIVDVGTQLRLACMKGVQASLRRSLNAYSWLTDRGAWLTPLPSGTWLPVADFLALDHRIVPTQQLRGLAIIGGCRFLRLPDLLAAARWIGAHATALANFCNRLIEENLLGSHRADNLGEAVVLRGTVTPLMRITTRTIRRTLERPRLTTLPIAQFLYRWQDFVNIPLTVGWPSLRRCAFSGHNADISVQLALNALPHPAYPASARETCCSSIRPLIREAINIIQQPPDLQGWLFCQGLDDDALAILASAKSSIHRFFLSLEMRGELRVRDLAGPAPSLTIRVTRNTCDDAPDLVPFCRRLVAENAESSHQERSLEEAVVLRRWAPVVDVPSISLAFSSLRRYSFGGHAAGITLRLALHALPHPGHPASSQPVCIACGSSDLSLAHRYWSCSAVRPLIREVFSIIGRPPDLQSWIFTVGLEDHSITISSAAKHAIYVFS
ncbi:hypothetical protein LAZ67_1003542 [Cordylochernes scorpioides]|uniref:Reverse transcriptase domain-containing protein n=1 Tax=Cordylochernes scorpioides TaxID=51811 RepID=A0ABY6JYL8_9ARAC|nr:hypothetical protein LAZ67_1003542 [Cordylochernes scorpioides]